MLYNRQDGGTSAGIAAWNGAAWRRLGEGLSWVNTNPTVLGRYGPHLIAAGPFNVAGGISAASIARWNGAAWSSLGTGITPSTIANPVLAVQEYNGDLIAAGLFRVAGGQDANNIARWDGSEWHPLGSGLEGTTNRSGAVNALTIYAGDVIAAGDFGTAGGQPASSIAAWNGASWHVVGGGTNGPIRAMIIYHGDLIAAGTFTMANNQPISSIARWNGQNWWALGPAPAALGHVRTLHIHNNRLLVGAAGGLWSWDGTAWRQQNWTADGSLLDLTTFQGELIAGGSFVSVNGVVSVSWSRRSEPCAADMDCSGTATLQDLFDFLAAWFGGDSRADIDGIAGVTLQDLFDFLAAWFAGC